MMVPGQEQLSPAAGPRIKLTPSVCRHSKLSLKPETEQWTHNIFFTCQTLIRLVLPTLLLAHLCYIVSC